MPRNRSKASDVCAAARELYWRARVSVGRTPKGATLFLSEWDVLPAAERELWYRVARRWLGSAAEKKKREERTLDISGVSVQDS